MLAFVFVEINFTDDVIDSGLVVALLDDLCTGEAFFHVETQDAVEHGVGGQGVFVLLAGAEFGGGRFIDRVNGDDLASAVYVSG